MCEVGENGKPTPRCEGPDSGGVICDLLVGLPSARAGGIGTALVKEAVKRFQCMGVSTTSATVTEKSLLFWEKVGFRKTKAFIVGNW